VALCCNGLKWSLGYLCAVAQVVEILVMQLEMQATHGKKPFRKWLRHLQGMLPRKCNDWLELRQAAVELLPDFHAFLQSESIDDNGSFCEKESEYEYEYEYSFTSSFIGALENAEKRSVLILFSCSSRCKKTPQMAFEKRAKTPKCFRSIKTFAICFCFCVCFCFCFCGSFSSTESFARLSFASTFGVFGVF
jgi:hypothetical protein